MKIGIIGASYLQLPAYIKANEMGLKTVGFAWSEGAVAKEYCDRFYPVSIVEKEQILKICKKEKIDGILTIASDVAVPTVSYVASSLGLIGNSIESATYSTNKFFMRNKFRKAGIRCPEYQLIENKDDFEKIGEKIKYPVIVKPVDRSGSKGVNKVLDIKDLGSVITTALEASLCKQAIIEEFIDGVEVSLEMISYNGIHYELAVTDKVTSGPPHFVELEHHQPCKLELDIQTELIQTAKKGLDALDIKFGASHTEFIISAKGIFITEIGARMGGDFIGSDLVYLSTGYDFLFATIMVALGHFEIPKKNWEKFAGVYFYSELTRRVGDIIRKKKVNPDIIRSEIQTDKIVRIKESSDRAGYFIYQGDNKISI